MNAQKLSNRSRLVNYFDFVCTKESTSSNNSKLLNNNPTTNDIQFKSPITTRRQHQLLNSQKSFSNQTTESCKNQFKLFAVVMHSGVSLNSGHYTAFVNYKIISKHENNEFGKYICTISLFFLSVYAFICV